MQAQRYRLGLGDGAYGPGDIEEIVLSDGGVIRGPDLPNWQGEYLLGVCEMPTSHHDQALLYLLLSPRYVGDSLAHIRQSGGVVGVGRVLPGRDPRTSRTFDVTDVEYWAVGVLSLLKS
jgi:hypothetical protein